MQLKSLLSVAVILVSTTVIKAQVVNADSVQANSNQKANLAQDWKDSAKGAKALRPNEKQTLNKDYNSVQSDYQANKAAAKNNYGNLNEAQRKQALKSYGADSVKYKSDKAALQKQKAQFDRANADGKITPDERAAMRKKYNQDKAQYKKQKQSVNKQKASVQQKANN